MIMVNVIYSPSPHGPLAIISSDADSSLDFLHCVTDIETRISIEKLRRIRMINIRDQTTVTLSQLKLIGGKLSRSQITNNESNEYDEKFGRRRRRIF